MSLSQALNQFAQNLGRYPQALYPRSDSIVRFLHGRPGSIEPDRCHIRIADDWRFRKIYENVIFR